MSPYQQILIVSNQNMSFMHQLFLIDRHILYSLFLTSRNLNKCGRVLYNGRDVLRIQHWIQDLTLNSTSLTPSSRPLSVKECPGCSLHNPQTFANSGQQHRNRQLYESYTCCYTLPHNQAVLLKKPTGFFQKGLFARQKTMTLYTNLSSVTADIKACLNITPSNSLSSQSQTRLITMSSSPPAMYFHAANDYLLMDNDLRSFLSTCFQDR